MANKKPLVNYSGSIQEMAAGDVLPVANGGTGLVSPGTAGNVLTSDGEGWVSSGGASTITTPTITAPTNTQINFVGAMVFSAYATAEDFYGTHDKTWVQISTDSGFVSLFVDEVINTPETTYSFTGWQSLTQYWVRVRYGSDNHWSQWSATHGFTTDNIYTAQPTLTVEGSPLDVPENPLLQTSAFSTVNGSDTHLNTDWQVLDGTQIVVWESLADSVNKLSIIVPLGLLTENTEYTFRARHRGTTYGVSEWGSVVASTMVQFPIVPLLAVAHAFSPFITIYDQDIDTFTKLADPSVLPTGTGYGVAFSSDDLYMAVAHDTSPFITIYKRNGDVFTKLANPSVLPTNTGNGVAFSSDDLYMAVAHGSSPYITIYKRNGDVFTKLANPSVLPTNAGYDVAFSNTGFPQ